ncbi:conjugative transposon protein TraN [Hymenobacter sp. NST-14]|uniref:DUF4138 domain-containing protein n=1 Tax=Hymenobacter piscis TaxID=2839984 RepID=UPI001C029CB0|nr:DUF4138 domain-containing protein [Hymenobacter piscis]MBT9394396.1 conjugative transposon protein TraN [Hymenobacter piscis]
MSTHHSFRLALALSLSLLCSAGSYAQRLKRVPATPPPATLPAYSPATSEAASPSTAPITPGPAPAHAGGYTDTGLHYTIERLAPPPPPPPPGSQPMLLDVAVSDSSTTYMVFAGPVSLVDVGMMDNYLLKIEANAVFVRARKKSAPPTPIMVRYGSKYWMGRLVTVKRPVMALYDLTKPSQLPPVPNGAAAAAAAYYNTAPAGQSSAQTSATVAGGGMSAPGPAGIPDSNLADVDAPTVSTGAVMPTSSTGVAPDNPLALDREAHRKAFVNAKLRRLDNLRVEHPGVAVYENRVAVSLANVRNDKEFTYLRLQVNNNSSIDYHIDFVDFQLVENTKRPFLGKKRNESRRPLTPSGGRANQVIAGGTTGYLYYAVPLYAATDLGYLHVELHELNGARTLLLPIPAKVINTAPTL